MYCKGRRKALALAIKFSEESPLSRAIKCCCWKTGVFKECELEFLFLSPLFHLHSAKAFVMRRAFHSYQVKCNKLVSNSLPLKWVFFQHLMVINREGCQSPSMLLALGFLLFSCGRESSWVGVWKLLQGATVRYHSVAKVASWLSASSNLSGQFPLGK